MTKKLLLTVFLVINLFFASTAFAQSIGDYRSNVNTTGNWTDLSSWHRWDGSSWIQPSVGQGYPGQNIGTGAVLIQAGDVINIGASGISTEIMGVLTINGSLVLTGINTGSVGTNFFFNTQTIIVTPLSGTIKFVDKVNLKLPTNATLQVKFDLTPNPDYYGLIGDCNHNQDIIIGSSTYAYCNGGGITGLTFYEVMDGGGTLNSAPSSNSPICYGNTIMLFGGYIGPIGTGITYNWIITDPTGSSTTVNAKDASIINAIAGNYVIKLICSTVYGNVAYSNSETLSVTVNSLPTNPTVGTITQPTCALPTGSVVLNGLPASGTWILTRSPEGVTTSGTGTSTTISGLASGTYTYTVSNGSCTSGASSNVVIDATTNTWNVVSGVGSWTNTLTSAQAITFNGNYNSAGNSLGDLTACSCTVNAGVSVNINSGDTLTLTNGLTVDTSGFGEITFFNGSSLLQINNVANLGDIDYERSTSARKTDYTYWSSPVSPQTLGQLYPVGSTFYSYEATSSGEDWKEETSTTIMTAGKGYIANRGAEVPSGIPTPPGLLSFTFVGVPNNGNLPISPIYANKSYLLGNPYPSAINADIFLADNSGVLNGTLYFWTHKTEIQDATNITDGTAGSGAFAYTSNDYATYNITGGVGIDSGTVTGSAPSGGAKPNGFISAGQGFFASTKVTLSGTSILFNNSMRVAGGTTLPDGTKVNEQFFKTKNPNKSAKTIEKNRIWLNLTNTQGAFKQALVGYITDATNEYDDRFDGESFDGNEFVDFYSVNQDKNLVIQGRALPFDAADEVPLGFRTTINGAFTLSIDQVDGFLTNQAVFIEDKLTNTVFDLKSGNYTFNTTAGTFNDRFVLRYTNTNKTLGTSNFDSLEKTVLVSNKNKQIKIDSSLEMIDKVTVFDLLGRQIYQKANVNSNELSISNLVSNRQMLMVKTVLQNGQEVSNKIVY